MSIILGILVILVSVLLYAMIDEWYIKPYEIEKQENITLKENLSTAIENIGILTKTLEETKSKKKVSKKSAEKKEKILVKLEPEDIVKDK